MFLRAYSYYLAPLTCAARKTRSIRSLTHSLLLLCRVPHCMDRACVAMGILLLPLNTIVSSEYLRVFRLSGMRREKRVSESLDLL